MSRCIQCILIFTAISTITPGLFAETDSKPFDVSGLYREQDCGIVSLAVVCKLLDLDVSIDRLRQMIPLEKRGANAASLIAAAKEFGLNPIGVKCSIEALAKKNTLAIIEVKKGHLAVFVGVNRDTQKLLIVDLPKDPYYLSVAKLKENWGGRALLFPAPTTKTKKNRLGPRISVKPDTADLGIIWQGDKPSCEFEISNTGDADLRLLRVVASCGCTTHKLKKNQLCPGETTTLHVNYDSSGTNSKALVVYKDLELLTNDKSHPLCQAKIKAVVKPRFTIQPQMINLQATKYTKLSNLARDIEIHFIDNLKTDIKKLKTSNSWLVADVLSGPKIVEKNNANAAQWMIKLRPNAMPDEIGTTNEKLLIHTNNPEYPIITVPIQFQLEGDYQVSPQMIYLGVIKPGEKAKRTIKIRTRQADTMFSISRISCSSSQIIANVNEYMKSAKNKHSIDVLFTTPSTEGRITESIVVYLDNGQSIRIPVFGFAREPKVKRKSKKPPRAKKQ